MNPSEEAIRAALLAPSAHGVADACTPEALTEVLRTLDTLRLLARDALEALETVCIENRNAAGIPFEFSLNHELVSRARGELRGALKNLPNPVPLEPVL